MALAGKELNLYGEKFSFRLSDGSEMKSSELYGSPAIVFFYNSKCGCKAYRKRIEKVYLDYKDLGLKVIGVGVRDNADKFFKFAKREGFSFPSTFDMTKELERNCRVYRLPHTLFITKEGNIERKAEGYMEEDEIREQVEKLIL